MVELSGLQRNVILTYAKVAKRISDGSLKFFHINFEHEINALKQVKEKTREFVSNPTKVKFIELWKRENIWAAQMGGNATNLLRKNGLEKITETLKETYESKDYNEKWEEDLSAKGSLREFWGKLKNQPLENECADRALQFFGYQRPESYLDFLQIFDNFRNQYLSILKKQATNFPINVEIDQLINIIDKLCFKDLSIVINSDLKDLCLNILVLKHHKDLKDKLKKYSDYVQSNIEQYLEEEGYKFEAVAEFRDKFNLEAENFKGMLDESLRCTANLIESGNYYPRKMLLQYYDFKPEQTKKAIVSLLSEDEPNIKKRVDDFTETFREVHKEMQRQGRISKDIQNTYIDYRFASFLLAAVYPERYFYIKFDEYSKLIKNLESNVSISESSQGSKFLLFTNFASFLKKFLENEDQFLDVHKKLTEGFKYKDDSLSWGIYDFIFAYSRYLMKNSWIFQGNPERFDVISYLKESGKKEWSANQNRSDMRVGDDVYFWKSGDNAGIYAYGSIISEPKERDKKDPEIKFGNWSVGIKIEKYLGDDYISKEIFGENSVLKRSKIMVQPQGTNFLLTQKETNEVKQLMEDASKICYWQIAPGPKAAYWKDCLEGGFICVGWNELGDLSNIKSREQLEVMYKKVYATESSQKLKLGINQLWNFLSLKESDKIVANKGKQVIVGVGEVTGGYRFNKDRKEYRHLMDVKWHDTREHKIPVEYSGKFGRTILELTKEEFEEIAGEDNVVNGSYYDFYTRKGFIFPKETLTNYLLCLKTKPFVILTGISGTGKTKIAQLFAEYFAPDEEKEIAEPVPPNEKGSYYYQIKPYFLKYKRLVLSRELEEMMDIPDPGKSKEIEVIFDGQSQMCYLKYWIQSEKYDYTQINFRNKFNKWAKDNLQVGDYIHIEVLPGEDDEKQKLKIEKFIPETKKARVESDRYVFISVRPDWMDCKGLLGFYNLITQEYQPTEFLKLLLRAKKNYENNKENPLPYFVILDEMNLAKVEYYFADFLSCLESRRLDDGEIKQEPIILHDQKENLKFAGKDEEYLIPPKLKIPPNVFFTGTVNIDETTYMFSPKVLDRANVIEFNQVSLTGEGADNSDYVINKKFLSAGILTENLNKTVATRNDYESLSQETKTEINSVHRILEDYNLHFGYRVANEMACYLENAEKLVGKNSLNIALDLQILQKILPKFHGSKQKLEEPLLELLKFVLKDGEVQVDGLRNELKNKEVDWDAKIKASKYPRSAKKLFRMLKTLNGQGFVSFIE